MRQYQAGQFYLSGSLLLLARTGDARLMAEDVTPVEAAEYVAELREQNQSGNVPNGVRIFTTFRKPKRKSSSTGWPN